MIVPSLIMLLSWLAVDNQAWQSGPFFTIQYSQMLENLQLFISVLVLLLVQKRWGILVSLGNVLSYYFCLLLLLVRASSTKCLLRYDIKHRWKQNLGVWSVNIKIQTSLTSRTSAAVDSTICTSTSSLKCTDLRDLAAHTQTNTAAYLRFAQRGYGGWGRKYPVGSKGKALVGVWGMKSPKAQALLQIDIKIVMF